MSRTVDEASGPADAGTQRRPRRKGATSRLGKWLLAALGVLATILGLIGIVVPLLPTTPLLLLAAACFVRSSDRMYHWLIGNRWFGHYIRDYREHRAVPRHAKITALVMLWGVIGSSAILVDSWWVRGLLAVIAGLVTVHVLRLKTIDPKETPRVRAAPIECPCVWAPTSEAHAKDPFDLLAEAVPAHLWAEFTPPTEQAAGVRSGRSLTEPSASPHSPGR